MGIKEQWNTKDHFEEWVKETLELCISDLFINPLRMKDLQKRFLTAYNRRLYPNEAVIYIAETYNLHIPDYRPPAQMPGEELVTVAIFVGSTYITTQRVKEKEISTLSDKIRSAVPKGMVIRLTVLQENNNDN